MKKTLLISMIIISILLAAFPITALAAPVSGSNYTDISGKWFTDDAAVYGYTEIFSDGSGKFNPDKKITRIEFVRLLHKALGININYFVAPDVSDDFSDMKNTDIGAGELIDLTTAGIVERGGNFNPNKQLERDVMTHWMMNALSSETGGSYAIPKIKLVPFDDDKDITEAYKTQLHNAQLLRLILGRGNNMFFPRDTASRAEAVTIVSRLVTLLSDYKTDVIVSASAWVLNGGILEMSLTIRNNSAKTITINHTSGQKYDFKLFDAAGGNLYTWSADKLFIAALGTTELKAGESVVYSDTLDSEAFSALSSAVTLRAFIVGTSSDFTIDTNGYPAGIVK